MSIVRRPKFYPSPGLVDLRRALRPLDDGPRLLMGGALVSYNKPIHRSTRFKRAQSRVGDRAPHLETNLHASRHPPPFLSEGIRVRCRDKGLADFLRINSLQTTAHAREKGLMMKCANVLVNGGMVRSRIL